MNKIDFSKNSSKKQNMYHFNETSIENNKTDETYYVTLQMLKFKNPNKISYSYQEAANELNVNLEFIRRRVKIGRIKASYFGDKPSIHLTELAKILSNGVK